MTSVSRSLHSAKYFLRPYLDETGAFSVWTREIEGVTYTVYRRNHGLAHSFRQGFLARDIITLLGQTQGPMAPWLKSSMAHDPRFSQKTATLASFQRSGRESEIAGSQDLERYTEYMESDCSNFLECFTLGSANKSNDVEEIKALAPCLLWPIQPLTQSKVKLNYLSRIIKAAHLLDLRRIPRFSKLRIMKEVSETLMINPGSISGRSTINRLWKQSGRYLEVSGDRDMMRRDVWDDKFFVLQSKPEALFFHLKKVMLS
jgi:hypothetical protein